MFKVLGNNENDYDLSFIRDALDSYAFEFIDRFNPISEDNDLGFVVSGVDIVVDLEDDTTTLFLTLVSYRGLEGEDIEFLREEWEKFLEEKDLIDAVIILLDDFAKPGMEYLGRTDCYSVLDLEKFYEKLTKEVSMLRKEGQFKRIKKIVTTRQKFDSEPSNIQDMEKEHLDDAVNLPLKKSSFMKTAVVKECKKSDIDDPKTDKWCVYSHNGKQLLGRYPTYEKAVARLRQVEYFRLKNKK